MEKSIFNFVVLRYVHDLLAGESLNVGLVAYWPDTGELRFRLRKSIGRVRQVFPDVDRKAFLRGIASIRISLARVAKSARTGGLFLDDTDALQLATRAIQQDDSAFQWSGLGRGAARQPDEDFSRLYDRLVAHYDALQRYGRPDEAIWRPVRDQLALRDIEIEFEERSLVGATDEITFDNTWKNGVWHAYQAISLDLSTAENILDKARRWRGQMAGVAEGTVSDFDWRIYFLLGRPSAPELQEAYAHAVRMFEHMPLSPRVFVEDQLIDLVDAIEEEYLTHERANERLLPPLLF